MATSRFPTWTLRLRGPVHGAAEADEADDTLAALQRACSATLTVVVRAAAAVAPAVAGPRAAGAAAAGPALAALRTPSRNADATLVRAITTAATASAAAVHAGEADLVPVAGVKRARESPSLARDCHRSVKAALATLRTPNRKAEPGTWLQHASLAEGAHVTLRCFLAGRAASGACRMSPARCSPCPPLMLGR